MKNRGKLFLIALLFTFLISISSTASAFTVQTAYIANWGSNTVSVIDTTTNTVTASIPVGSNPIGVAVNPAGTLVYVTNAGSNNVSVIDTATNTVTASVPLGSYPFGVTASPDGSRVYVANHFSNNVSVIDTTTNTVTASIPVGSYPIGVAVTPDGSNVYVTNDGSNNVSVIDTATNTVIATVEVGFTPKGVVVNPEGTLAYIAVQNSFIISVIDTATNNITATVSIGNHPYGVAISPDGTKVYVSGSFNGDPVRIFDTATNNIIATVTVGNNSAGIAVTPDGSNVYVPNQNTNSVYVIDTANNTVTATVNVGSMPDSFGQFIGSIPVRSTPTIIWNNPPDITYGTPLSSTQLNAVASVPGTYVYTPPAGTILNVDTQQLHVDFTPTDIINYNTASADVQINVIAPQVPIADFSAAPTSGIMPLNVVFTDASVGTPTSWKWDFGDGKSSNQQNPSHIYQSGGTYTVSLTVTNKNGSNTMTKTNYITVTNPSLAADFSATPTSGTMPLNVVFTDASVGIPTSWKWDFGDGKSSNQQNPSHVYQNGGTYTVSLTVKNKDGTDTKTKTNYITVTNPSLAADFTATPTSGTVPLNAVFTDTSTGTPTSWKWDFGDGKSSNQQSPSHTYKNPGTYTVSLTVKNKAGTDTETKIGYINVFSN